MDDLVAQCGQLAQTIQKLAKETAVFDEFAKKCAMFARVSDDLLRTVWDLEREHNRGQPAASAAATARQLEPNNTEPASSDECDQDIDRQWYADEPLVLLDAPPPKPRRLAGMPVRLFYRHQLAPFLRGTDTTTKLVQPMRDPTGNLAQHARNGSEFVRQLKRETEKRTQVRERMAARGTLKALEAEGAGEGRANDAPVETTAVKLPANQCKDELLAYIRENQVLIVVGETGSGKTTQLPQILLEAGFCDDAALVCTQPRRVAAMSVAARVASEQHVTLGSTVGYSIRFEDKTSAETKIKFLTDGILLREALSDPMLERYSVVIIDEAHERALNTDLILGVLKQLLRQRQDLKVVITSATLNAALFSKFFGNAPVYTIPGRTFPVHIENVKLPVSDYVQAAIKQALSIHLTAGTGDILVFMTGKDDIEATCDGLVQKLAQLDGAPVLDVLPIYSQMPQDLQDRIFSASAHRKVIVATNIAETSLTIPGIKYVVDSGYTKVKVYQPKYGVDTLQVVPISKANASQRAGRAGRTSEGHAYRLYTKLAEEDELYEQPIPEISRTNLSNTVLFLKRLGLDVDEFDFLDRPDQAAINASLQDLWILGALNSNGSLSELGHRLSLYPLNPFMARMLVASIDAGCSDQMLTIVAVMSVPPIFIRSSVRSRESDAAREKFQVPESDHLTLLNVYNEWTRHGCRMQWCKDNFIQHRSLVHAREVHQQLARLVGVNQPDAYDDTLTLRRCICQAFFHQAAQAKGLQSYTGITTGVELFLHPTSSLYGLGYVPPYVVYNEVMVTSKQYMTLVTQVEPDWLLEYGSLIYSDGSEPSTAATASEDPPAPTPRPKFKRTKRQQLDKNKKFMRGI